MFPYGKAPEKSLIVLFFLRGVAAVASGWGLLEDAPFVCFVKKWSRDVKIR